MASGEDVLRDWSVPGDILRLRVRVGESANEIEAFRILGDVES